MLPADAKDRELWLRQTTLAFVGRYEEGTFFAAGETYEFEFQRDGFKVEETLRGHELLQRDEVVISFHVAERAPRFRRDHRYLVLLAPGDASRELLRHPETAYTIRSLIPNDELVAIIDLEQRQVVSGGPMVPAR